jgi:transcriptional regulator with XRE-family HTH domain
MNAVVCMLNLRKLKIVNMERHERIAKAITVSGLKKGEVAAACNVANSAITQWITGESKSLKPENLYALAKATGFNAMWIAIGEGPERPDEGSTSGKKSANLYTYPVLSWT